MKEEHILDLKILYYFCHQSFEIISSVFLPDWYNDEAEICGNEEFTLWNSLSGRLTIDMCDSIYYVMISWLVC